MKKGIAKFTAFCLASGLVFGEGGTVLLAAGNTDLVLAGLGSFSSSSTKSAAEESSEETAAQDSSAEAAEKQAQPEAKATADANTETEAWTEAETDTAAEVKAETEAETEKAPLDKSMVNTRGFALCDEYLNVRASGDTQGEVVGKIYNYGSLEILDVDEYGWYKVRSGNVEGYVAQQYVATGALAEEIAADAGYTTAEVGAEVLNIRSAATTDSDIIGTISNAQEVEVVEDGGDWVKVVVDGMYGYVSTDYVYTSTAYATAESVEEEQARLDAQWLDYLASQQAQQTADNASSQTRADDSSASYEDSFSAGQTTDYGTAQDDAGSDFGTGESAAEAGYGTYDGSNNETGSETSYYDTSSYEEAEAYSQEQQQAAWDAEYQAQEAQQAAQEAQQSTYDAQAAAEAQYQAYLDAQAAADEATSGMDEQAVYDTAAAASAAYEEYLSAQAAADAAAQAEADAAAQAAAAQQAQEQAQAAAEAAQQAYEDTYSEATDNGSSDDTYYDDGTSYEEENTYYDDGSYDDGSSDEDTSSYDDGSSYEDTSSYDDGSSDEDTSSYDDGSSYQEPSYSSVGQQIADYAVQFVGNPYVWGGSSLTGGADCSGFTMAVMANFGISLPHNAAAQSGCGTSVSLDALQPGDLLFYYGDGGIGHVSIYIGGGQVVHASNPTNGIIISDIGYRTPCSATRLV